MNFIIYIIVILQTMSVSQSLCVNVCGTGKDIENNRTSGLPAGRQVNRD